MTRFLRIVALLAATTVAEAWCQSSATSEQRCFACDCEEHHPGYPIEGCQCDCAYG